MKLLSSRGMSTSSDSILCMLKECSNTKDLDMGRKVLSLITSAHLETMPMLGDQLIRMFATCGSLHYVNQVFGQITKRSLSTWHAIISAHASLGHSYIALELFYCMYYQGDIPNRFVFACTVKVCARVAACMTGKLLHHAIVCVSLEPDVVVGCAVVDMYLRCGCVRDARCIFERQMNRNVVTWGAMIGGYTELGQGSVALELFKRMQNEGLYPDRVIYICLLKACGQIPSILHGFLVHAMIGENRLDFETSVVNSLIDMYAKCGMFDDAFHLFNKQQHNDIISWGSLIAAYARRGHKDAAFRVFEEMRSKGMKPNKVVLLCVLQACSSTILVYYIHDIIVKSDFSSDRAIENTLVNAYAKCGSLEDAHIVFGTLKYKDEISWSAMMTGYTLNGRNLRALNLLVEMEESGIKPDKFAISGGLKACGGIGAILEGRLLHARIVKDGLDSVTVVANALLDMYVKCGRLEEARRVFDKLSCHDTISWAAMIGGYADYGRSVDALKLSADMNRKGLEPSKVGFLALLKASSHLESMMQGKIIHDQLIRSGFESDITIGNTLVDAYCKCGGLEEAYKVFDQLSDRTVVSWGVIIAGYAQHEYGFTALELFERMHKEGVEPSRSIFLSSLKACGSIAAVAQGNMIHDQVLRNGCESDEGIGNTLLDMYAKCGCVEEALKIFESLQPRSEVTWAAMIAAYASRGDTKMVQQFLGVMRQEGVELNGTIFMCVLMTCGHAGKIDEGQRLFKSMLEVHGFAPSDEHYTCMIDLLGRVGQLLEAKQFLQCMPISSDISGWMALLTACGIYSNVELAKQCFDELVKLDPDYTAGYLLMSKIFAEANMWDDVYKLERAMGSLTALKKPGKTQMEVGDVVQGDQISPLNQNLYPKLRSSARSLKQEGAVAHMDEYFQGGPQQTRLGVNSGFITTNGKGDIQSCENSHTVIISPTHKESSNETIHSENLQSKMFLL